MIARVKNIKLHLFFLLVVTLVGLTFRIRLAMIQPLWLDEAFSFQSSQLPVRDLVFQNGTYQDFSHPTGYYLFLKIWASLGQNEFFLRFPSLIAYLATCYFVYSIGYLLHNKTTGAVSLLFFSLHPFFIALGFQARMYPLVICTLVASLYTLFTTLSKQTYDKNHQLKLSLLLALSLYLDFSTVWLIASLGATWLLMVVQQKKSVSAFLEKALLYTLLFTFPQIISLIAHFWSGVALASHMGDLTFSRFLMQLFSIPNLAGTWPEYILSLGAWGITLWYLTMKWRKTDDQNLPIWIILGFALVLPLVLSGTFSFLLVNIFQLRNILLVHLSFIFIFSTAIVSYKKISSHVYLAFFLTIFLIALALRTPTHFDDFNWYMMRGYIERGYKVIFLISTHKPTVPLTAYYAHHPYPVYPQFSTMSTLLELNSHPDTNGNYFIFSFYPDNWETSDSIKNSSFCQVNHCVVEVFDPSQRALPPF